MSYCWPSWAIDRCNGSKSVGSHWRYSRRASSKDGVLAVKNPPQASAEQKYRTQVRTSRSTSKSNSCLLAFQLVVTAGGVFVPVDGVGQGRLNTINESFQRVVLAVDKQFASIPGHCTAIPDLRALRSDWARRWLRSRPEHRPGPPRSQDSCMRRNGRR